LLHDRKPLYINKDGYFETDLYKKDGSVVQYLLSASCHPSHITKNIPYSLAFSLLRICSDRATFLKRIEEMRQDLLSRTYHPKILESAFKRILKGVKHFKKWKKTVKKTKTHHSSLHTTQNYHPSQISRESIGM
jgi:hypothetical protein